MLTNFTPEITCIVPVYNVEKYLHRCIDSILAQTFIDFELILIDDGSPDSCGKICDEYAAKDRRVKVIHQENKGVSAARNAGLDAATGKYVCFVDSDDFIKKEYMQIMYETALETDADLVMCGIEKQEKSGTYKALNFNKTEERIACKNQQEVLELFTHLRSEPENTVELHSSVNKLYRSCLLNGIRFKTNLIRSEDYCFVLECFYKLSNLILIQDNLYAYCFNPSSAVNSFKENQFEGDVTAINETEKFFDKFGLNKKIYFNFKRDSLYSCIIRSFLLPKMSAKNHKNYKLINKMQPHIKLTLLCRSKFNFKKNLIIVIFKTRIYFVLDFLCSIWILKNARQGLLPHKTRRIQ